MENSYKFSSIVDLSRGLYKGLILSKHSKLYYIVKPELMTYLEKKIRSQRFAVAWEVKSEMEWH